MLCARRRAGFFRRVRRLPKVRARFGGWTGVFEVGEIGGGASSPSAWPSWRSVGVRVEAWEKRRWRDRTGVVISLDSVFLLGGSHVSGNSCGCK